MSFRPAENPGTCELEEVRHMTMKCRLISKVLGASNKILGVEEPWDGGLSDKFDFY